MAKRHSRQAATDDRSGSARDNDAPVALVWMRAAYRLHTFVYRDPRSSSSAAMGLPVVSPTAVLLGIPSTLFNLGMADEAREFLDRIHRCAAVVDPPEGAVFFRAFHQLRRYVSDKYPKSKPRLGLTNINQGTKEYALVEGPMTIFAGVPDSLAASAKLALENRDHLGSHDSLCSLVGEVESVPEPSGIIYLPPERWHKNPPPIGAVTILTLARFKSAFAQPTVGNHWWMAGGDNTELVEYLVKGTFTGTTRGKIYRKNPPTV